MLDETSPIAIVGGSLVGPTMALMLERVGFRNVHVFEAVPPTISQAGGIIGLDHISIEALREIGITYEALFDFHSERIVVNDGEDVSHFPGRNTTWTKLHDLLMSHLALTSVQYHGGKKVVGISDGNLGFSDGTNFAADFIAFADGRKSIGRALLDPDRKLQYAGYVAFRGLYDEDCPPITEWSSWQTDGARMGSFPVKIGNGIGIDWAMYLNVSRLAFTRGFGAEPEKRSFVLPHQITTGAIARVNAAATRIFPEIPAQFVVNTRHENRFAVPMVDTPKPDRAVFGNTVLIGDALLPVRPHTGGGANNGIDQAANLTRALRQVMDYGADLAAALNGWQRRQLPIANAVMERGQRLAKTIGLGTM